MYKEPKLNRKTFGHGIKELSLFFKSFTPRTNQLSAWYDRLKHTFEDDHMRMAVFDITEHDKSAPSFAVLRAKLFIARKRLAVAAEQEIVVEGGHAPLTPRKHKLEKECMRGILECIDMEDAEMREDNLQAIKDYWLRQYRSLPGYTGKAACLDIVKQKDWRRAKDLGIIEKEPVDRTQFFIPLFTEEKQQSRSVQPKWQGEE